MNKKEFEKLFRSEILPVIREQYEKDGKVDRVARREEWNDFIDGMVQDGQLPENATNWVCPW